MPKVLILYLCALLCLIPTHSALLKGSLSADDALPNAFPPSFKAHSVEDMVSSILESPELPLAEIGLTATISPEEAKEHDLQIQKEIIAEIANPQNHRETQNDIQINQEAEKNDSTPTEHEDLHNVGDSHQNEPLVPQKSSPIHNDIIEPSLERKSSETVDTKNSLDADAEVENAQVQKANEILESDEGLEQSSEAIRDNFGSNLLETANEKSEMEKMRKSDASETTQEKTAENSSTGKNGKSHSREIFVQTGQGDGYFHKGPVFILGVGIVVIIILAFRMMTEEIDGKMQDYEEERESLMTS